MKVGHGERPTGRRRRFKRLRRDALQAWREGRGKDALDVIFFDQLRQKIIKAGRVVPQWGQGAIPLYGHIRKTVLEDLTGDRKNNPTRDLIILHLIQYRRIPVSVRRALKKKEGFLSFQRSMQYDLINYIHYLRGSHQNPEFTALYNKMRACTARHRCGVIVCPICKIEKRESLFRRVYKTSKRLDSSDLKLATFFFGITEGDFYAVRRLQESGIRRIRFAIDTHVKKGLSYFEPVWFVGMIEVDFVPNYVTSRVDPYKYQYGGKRVSKRWSDLFCNLGYSTEFTHSPILVTYHAIAHIPNAKKVARKLRSWPKERYGGDVRQAELDAQRNNRPFFPVGYQIRFQELREKQKTKDAIDLLVTYMSKMNSAYTDINPDIGIPEIKRERWHRPSPIILKGVRVKYINPLNEPDINERLRFIARSKFQSLKREINFGRRRS